jgi:hypothetical protein
VKFFNVVPVSSSTAGQVTKNMKEEKKVLWNGNLQDSE